MKLTQSLIEKIVSLSRAYGATRLILFGSAADRPEEARDIDLACDGVPGWKLYELAARLEEELHTPLDIVPLRVLQPTLQSSLKPGARPCYDLELMRWEKQK